MEGDISMHMQIITVIKKSNMWKRSNWTQTKIIVQQCLEMQSLYDEYDTR